MRGRGCCRFLLLQLAVLACYDGYIRKPRRWTRISTIDSKAAAALQCASVPTQALAGEDKGYMKGQKTLEINPRHPIVQELRRQVAPPSHSGQATN